MIVVRVAGNLDDFGGAHLDDALRTLGLTEQAPAVVLDLARVTLLDGSGMGHLIESCNTLTSAGGTLELRRVRPPVARVLCLLDRDHHVFACSARTPFIASSGTDTARAGRTARSGVLISPLHLGPRPASNTLARDLAGELDHSARTSRLG